MAGFFGVPSALTLMPRSFLATTQENSAGVLPTPVTDINFPSTTSFCRKNRLLSEPTIKATPVITRIKTPPTSTARFNSFLLLTVIKRTANCGWASTPIPTPNIIVLTTIHQRLYAAGFGPFFDSAKPQPNSGIAVHPLNPIPPNKDGALPASVSASCAAATPPSIL